MKICLVSAFPPSHGRLNEYGYHLARELQRDPLLSVVVLGDKLTSPAAELEDFEVLRCWDFNSLSTPVGLLKTIRELRPDVVWFNLVFSSFGDKPAQAFFGLWTPVLARLAGYYTHITLHHVMENVNLADAGIRFPRLYRLAGALATRLLLMANSVSVLLPAYRRTLLEKYRGTNIHLRAHGIFSSTPDYPDFSLRGNSEHRILAFGKWGTYKRVEGLIEAFAQVAEKIPHARLVIAGGNHPVAAGYIESMRERFQGCSRIEFTGYVPEDKLAELFRRATVAVLPYSSAGGPSGVAHQACQFGVPLVSADLADFRDMADEEGIAIEFYEPGDSEALARVLTELLEDPERQRQMAEQNFSAAMCMTMPEIIRQYLRSFDRQRRARMLESVSRFRRLPSWVPTRSVVLAGTPPGIFPLEIARRRF